MNGDKFEKGPGRTKVLSSIFLVFFCFVLFFKFCLFFYFFNYSFFIVLSTLFDGSCILRGLMFFLICEISKKIRAIDVITTFVSGKDIRKNFFIIIRSKWPCIEGTKTQVLDTAKCIPNHCFKFCIFESLTTWTEKTNLRMASSTARFDFYLAFLGTYECPRL